MTVVLRDKKDSVETATLMEAQTQDTKDKNRMADAKEDQKRTKAKAKNAQRIESDANDAARESRYAVRAEQKAAQAREKSNNN